MTSPCFRGALLVSAFIAACSSDGTPAKSTPGDADAGTQPDAANTRRRDAFNGDCSTANWSSKSSDACWACMCKTCADTLNKCNDGCMSLLECGLDQHVIVGDAPDLQCEIRAFTATCLNDPATAPESGAVTNLDTCLIASHKAPEMLRACEAECGIVYTGDVCRRFPAPDGGSP